VVRNINKAILGAGDARLIARGAYQWSAEARAAQLGDPLYMRALDWKFRPAETAVCPWEDARQVWLAAADAILALGRPRRTLRHALRWLVRRRSLGNPLTFGLPPEVRLLRNMRRVLKRRGAFTPALKRDWEIFN